MAIALLNFAAPQTDAPIIAAAPGKIIRIHRIIAGSWGGMAFTLLTDPGGAKQAPLTTPLHVVLGAFGVYDFAPPYALQGGRSEALGVTTVFPGAPAEHSLMIWYEYVD